jgi:hypothetical protein
LEVELLLFAMRARIPFPKDRAMRCATFATIFTLSHNRPERWGEREFIDKKRDRDCCY